MNLIEFFIWLLAWDIRFTLSLVGVLFVIFMLKMWWNYE